MRAITRAASVLSLIIIATAPVVWVAMAPFLTSEPSSNSVSDVEVVQQTNRYFEQRWKEESIVPAGRASDLKVFRRLMLALWGRIPALEEIRAFEADIEPRRMQRWTHQLLGDRRFADYFAARLTRAMLGKKETNYPGVQPARFQKWLSDQIYHDIPYNQIAREVLSGQGVIPGNPATNFVTAEIEQGDDYQQRLTGRAVRAFLGQRIDCAQCHNHPFDHWKQTDFEGLAGHFGQVETRLMGLRDRPDSTLVLGSAATNDKRTVQPAVPFGSAWLPKTGTSREKLAAWITHKDNRRFRRAIVNRVWGLVFGKPYLSPVDEVPDPYEPDDPDETEILELLGADFQKHQYNLKRLVLIITQLKPFQLSSAHPDLDSTDASTEVEQAWAVFPLTRLRPEQMYGSLKQAGSVQALPFDDIGLSQMMRFADQRRFSRELGDFDEDELGERVDTIPQTLFRMNSRYTKAIVRASVWSASGRIARTASGPRKILGTSFLVCLTRQPTEKEIQHFLPKLQAHGNNQRQQVEDLFWALLNTTEHSWNH